MKYAIIQMVNGSLTIAAENITDIAFAKTKFHGICQALWSAKDVTSAFVMIVDEQLNCAEGYKEYIHH